MNDKIVIGIGHPLEFTEEASTKKFARRLGFFDLEGLFNSLFVSF